MLGVAALGLALAACQPAKKAPPAPPLAPPPPELSAPPPGSPTLGQEPVVGNLDTPWDIAFVPTSLGPTMLFTEKRAGTLSRINELGERQVIHTIEVHEVSATGTEGVEAAHAGHIESGLMGVAVHPQFATGKPWIYLSYSTEFDVRVERFELDTVTWAITKTGHFLTGIPFGEIHNGGRIRFQPGTTNLFVTTGDSTSSIASQFLGSAGGKVLRVNENLQAASDNPFYGIQNVDWRVYTFGHRNVQGLAFGPGGAPYTTEHGPDRNDEVNRLVPGGNGGWDPRHPDDHATYFQFVPMTDLAKFPHAMRPVWRSGDDRTLAPSGAEFLEGPQWGSWDGALVVASLKARRLDVMFLNPDGTIKHTWAEKQIAPVELNGQPRYPRLRAVTLAPDGNSLYVATDAPAAAVGDPYAGEIWKITPTPT